MTTYNKNFLTNVVYRLDFSDLEEFNDLAKLNVIYESIKEVFPVKNIGKSVENYMSIDLATNRSSTIQQDLSQLVCNSNDKKKRIMLNKRLLVVELSNYSYTNLCDFLSIIDKVHIAITGLKDKLKIKRMGVRYVNQIEIDEGKPFENSNMINENLTTKEIKFFTKDFQNKMNRSLSQTSFILDDYQVIFTNGYINSQFPAPILKNEYSVDIDCSTMSCEFDNIGSIVKKMVTETIYPLFEYSINDGLRKIMGI